jgi:hypothetical protein
MEFSTGANVSEAYGSIFNMFGGAPKSNVFAYMQIRILFWALLLGSFASYAA